MTTSTTLLKAIGADADSPRWTEFVARYKPVMESFLSREFPSVSADDVMQETLLVLVRKLPDYRYAPDEKGHFKSWLLGINITNSDTFNGLHLILSKTLKKQSIVNNYR